MTKKVTFGILFFSILSLYFVSCKNFLEGTDFIGQLGEAIKYSNAPFVTVTITSPNSITEEIVPAAGEYAGKYKKGDTFSIKFKPAEYCRFVSWEVNPEGSVAVANPDASETTFTILSDSEPIEIKTVCGSIPKVVQYTPTYDSAGVQCGSLIKVFFDQPMDDLSNIYWTYDELLEKGYDQIYASFVAQIFDEKRCSFSKITQDGIISDNNWDWENVRKRCYYYGYLEDDKLIMKNIEITSVDLFDNTEKSIMTPYRFMSPYFETPKCLVIPIRKGAYYINRIDSLPANSDITVKISGDFKSKEGIKLKEDFSFYYKTNSEYDVDAPYGKITGILGYNAIVPFEEVDGKAKLKDISELKESTKIGSIVNDENKQLEDIQNAQNVDELLALGVKPINHLAFINSDVIKDDDIGSEIRAITIELEPVECKAYANIMPQTLTYTKQFYGKKEIDLSITDNNVIFDIPEYARSSVYKINMYAIDTFGNSNTIDYGKSGDEHNYPQYCLFDNTEDENIKNIKPVDYNLTGDTVEFYLPKGEYIFFNDSFPKTPRGAPELNNAIKSYEEQKYKNRSFTKVEQDSEKVTFPKTKGSREYYLCTEDKLGTLYMIVYSYKASSNSRPEWKSTTHVLR